MSAPYGNNPYGPNTNPQGGNPYAPSAGGYGNPGHPQSGYPPPQQQPPQYGNNPYGPSNTGGYGAGYPPQGGSGYPPPGGSGYPPQGGSGYPPQGGNAYPPPNSGFPAAGGYPPTGGYPGAQPAAGGFMPNDPRMQRLNQVVQQYEINRDFAARLQALANCEIVVLCDDSGSMNTPLQGTNQTRWDELKSVCSCHLTLKVLIDHRLRSSIL